MKPEIYKDEGYRFMGAAFEVYNDRGYGLAEEIYQECLEIELELRRLNFRSKAETPNPVWVTINRLPLRGFKPSSVRSFSELIGQMGRPTHRQLRPAIISAD